MSTPKTSALDVVFFSGWAIPAAFLNPLQDCLLAHSPSGTHFRLTTLPGLTESANGALAASDWLAFARQAIKPGVATLLGGWSFGGTLAVALAHNLANNPNYDVRGLFTLAANPCFVQRADWRAGINDTLYQQFVELLDRDPLRLQKKFAALCFLGGDSPTAGRRRLMQHWHGCEFDAQQLQAGLQCMQSLDARAALTELGCPATHLFATQDAVAGDGLCTAVESLYSCGPGLANLGELGAGHAFFHGQEHRLIDHWQDLWRRSGFSS